MNEQPDMAERPPDGGGEETLIKHTLRRLLRDILVGVYKPGDRIREAEVSHRLRVSRAPVREALRVLEQDGMIELTPWRGARVIDPNPGEIADIFDLLAVNYGAVARFAVRHASDADLQRFVADIDDLERVKSVDMIDAAYRAGLHLGEMCGSRQAEMLYRRLGRVAYWLHRFLLPLPSRFRQQSIDQHRRLAEALLARNEERAEKAARRMVEHTRKLILLRADSAAAR